MRILFLVGVLSTLFTFEAFTCDIKGETGIVPENDLWIGPNDKGINNITEEEFNQVLDRIEEIYRPIVEEKGAELKIERAKSHLAGNEEIISISSFS